MVRDLVSQWLSKAVEDLEVGKQLLSHTPVFPASVAFHASGSRYPGLLSSPSMEEVREYLRLAENARLSVDEALKSFLSP